MQTDWDHNSDGTTILGDILQIAQKFRDYRLGCDKLETNEPLIPLRCMNRKEANDEMQNEHGAMLPCCMLRFDSYRALALSYR